MALRAPARWKAKAIVQRALSGLPHGHELNYCLQRRLTGGFPRHEAGIESTVAAARSHLEARARCGALDPLAGCFFEFGAGWDLVTPLVLHCLGVDQQVVVDIRSLLKAELVDDLVLRLSQRAEASGFARVARPRGNEELTAYLSTLGIEYRAPCDAADPGLADGSIACTTSTNTMEHIPPEQLRPILARCRRLLEPGGFATFAIDYEDHYAKFDPQVSVYNFLRYDEREWRRYNSSLHFQNRLRHREHRELLLEAGFTIVEEDCIGVTDEDLDQLATVPLAARWRGWDADELAIRGCRFSLGSPGSGA